MATATETQTVAGETKTPEQEAAGKIIEYQWFLKKKGRMDITVNTVGTRLRQLARKANILDPESVKDFLATNNMWANRTKAIDVSIYDGFLRYTRIVWEPPEYKPERKPTFIPTEEEINALIAGCGRRLAVFLQMLKETAVRCGECARLKWTNIDFQRKLVTVASEKHGNPRTLPISQTLIEMLSGLPRKSEKIFPATRSAISSNFYQQRKKLAKKLGNPRLLNIGFHTFRHWKLTMLAHEIPDPFYLQEYAGHRDIKSTMLYIHLEKQIFRRGNHDQFHVATAKTIEEALNLAANGYDYFQNFQGVPIYRKRK